jgi:hypothetical protein
LSHILNLEGLNDDKKQKIFISGLDKDKKKGFCKTEGQVDNGLIGFAISINNKKLGIEASLSSIFNFSDYRPEHEPTIYANLSSYAILIERYINKIFFEIEAYHNKDLNKG